MNPFQAKQQIHGGIDEYEAGRITLSALLTLVDITIDTLENDAFDAGLRTGDDPFVSDDDAGDDDEDEFEFEEIDEEADSE